MTSDLERTALVPDLWARSLGQRRSRPVLHIGERTLSAGEIEGHVSRYTQELMAQGLGPGSPTATLGLNGPEVLFASGAEMQVGCRVTPLTATASIDDQAYILEDAEIDTLLFDPALQERAAALSDRVPGLKRLLSLGACEVGHDLRTGAASRTAQHLHPP